MKKITLIVTLVAVVLGSACGGKSPQAVSATQLASAVTAPQQQTTDGRFLHDTLAAKPNGCFKITHAMVVEKHPSWAIGRFDGNPDCALDSVWVDFHRIAGVWTTHSIIENGKIVSDAVMAEELNYLAAR